MWFHAIVLDMHPYVADGVFARFHTFSCGYDKLRFIKPVFVGDTIYTVRTQLEKRPKYPEMGMVKVSYEVFKMPGELVLYCEHLQTVKYREPAKFKDQLQPK
jgi:acyl dehydratase